MIHPKEIITKHINRRNIITAVLLIAVVGLFLFFVIRPLVLNDSSDNIEQDNNAEPSANSPDDAPDDNASAYTLFSINGKSIPISLFGYYLYSTFSRLEETYMTNELNFDEPTRDGTPLSQYVIDSSINGVKYNIAVETLAAELKLDRALTETEVDEYLSSTILENFSGDEDAYRGQLLTRGTTLESFRDIMIAHELGNQVFEHYYGESWVSSVDPSVYYDRFVTTSNIFLLTTESEFDETSGELTETPQGDELVAQKRALAESIHKELNAGRDFFELLNEYGEDRSVMIENNPKQRYTFQRNEMIDEYSTVAFSIEVGEYSDIVETPYGYYIIYKLPLDTEAVDEIVKSQEFRNSLFNTMLEDLSKDFTFESTPLFESTSLEALYSEYKDINNQAMNN